ncbi:beta-mannosidase [Winogradskyella sp. A3E31]|uniref:beta-mannosidase n=1 Tax=Winogradskyella sp. A3E31 TaxID=3349637 RepID=UPI00398BAE22
MRYLSLLILLLCLSCGQNYDVPETITLKSDWEFRQVGDSTWYSATVPGNVFTDLMDADLIEDPFIGNNEEKVQWVSEADWEYKTTFVLDERTLEKKHLELNFEGLDTYAKVFLNDILILNANNAFRSWNKRVKDLLKAENELRIVFQSTSKYEESEKAKLPYQLPEGNRIFTRKAQFQYGWDWGPKLNASGIWKPISLTSWNDFRIEDINIQQLSLDENEASLLIEINDNNIINEDFTFDVYVNDSLYSEFKNPNPLMPSWIPLQIKNPKRWWPHNLGEPYLYNIKVIVKDGRTVLDSLSIKKGLRTIDLVAEEDSIGQSFYFKVNDVPVYAKGANYIPQNSFQNKVSHEDYDKLLNDVVGANMNMLRVWGGGIYEEDTFYDLCDEKGILVWQDFMFACAMYPGDDDFLNNVKKEAEQQVKRLRNHASIALWCGNNESSEGWSRWGWQMGRSETEKEEIWNNYLKLFDSILPQTVSNYSDIDYWESSPKYGRGNPLYKSEGDAHDWWIWHDGYPFEHLEENVPRFMSEFGFQSFPSYEAIKYINQRDSIDISSAGFKNHQKHSRGFQLIEEYMQRDFPVPDSPEDYVYMSQLLQAYGITKGIEAHRRARPYNMGTLYWQLNDCWPAVSWSSIDFLGNWKALQYKAKHSFENVLISSTIENDSLETWIVNDNLKPENGVLEMKVMTFSGDVIWQDSYDVNVEGGTSRLVSQHNINTWPENKNELVLISTFKERQSVFYFVKPKELNLPQEDIQMTIKNNENGFSIELRSESLQKDIFLFTKEQGHLSDNFFDLLPNETKTVMFQTQAKQLDDLQLKTFNSFIRPEGI